MSCPQDIADSTLERTYESSSYPTSDVDRFTLENFLELEEWHRQKLDDDRHPPECINRHPCLDELLGYTVEIEPIEERMHKSATSHFSVPKHQRLCEAVGIHKRVNQIHDPVKFVVPCFVFEAESPIPPERSVQPGSYIGVLDEHQHASISQIGLRYRGDFDKGPTKATSIDTSQTTSIDTDKTTSIDSSTLTSIDTRHESEHKKYEDCQNLFDEDNHVFRQVWGKEEEILEEEKKDQRRSSVIIDSLLLRWCQEIQSAQQMLLTSFCKA